MSRHYPSILLGLFVVLACAALVMSIPHGRTRNGWVSHIDSGMSFSHVASTSADSTFGVICSPGQNCMGYIDRRVPCHRDGTTLLLMSGGGATTGAEAVCQTLKIPGSDTGKVVAAFPFTFDVGRLFVDRKSQLVSIAFSNGIGKLETLSFPTKAFLKAYKDQLIVAQQGQNKPKEGNPLRREGQTYNLSQKYPESLGIRILDELLRVILHIIYPVEN